MEIRIESKKAVDSSGSTKPNSRKLLNKIFPYDS